MNKKIKRILSIMLIINFYSVAEPTKIISLTNKEVQADTTSIYLKSLSINKADIDFNSDKTYYSVNVDDSVDEVKITAKPKSDDSKVKVNDSIVDSNDKYRKLIELDSGENIIKIKVENDDNKSKTYTLIITRGKSNSDDVYLSDISLSEGKINFKKETSTYNIEAKSQTDSITIKAKPEDSNDIVKIDGVKVNEDSGYKQTVYLDKGKSEIIVEVENKKEKKRSYKLNITRQDDLNRIEAGNIYLDFIRLSDAEVNISKTKTAYDVKVKENVDLMTIQAEPESTEYMVEINGDAVEESEDYKKDVRLNRDKTEIQIKVEDFNNNKRIYTLNVYKGEIPSTLTDSKIESENENNKISKINQWIQVDNKWQYNDSTGQPLRNSWFYDRNGGKSYYLKADGSMATGWLSNNGHWYYLNESGAMQIEWKLINGEWYYFDSEGIMKTGWILDSNKKYYYLQENGVMAKSTIINGYKLGADGSWIKR